MARKRAKENDKQAMEAGKRHGVCVVCGICVCARACACVRVCVCACARARVRMCVCACAYACACACVRVCCAIWLAPEPEPEPETETEPEPEPETELSSLWCFPVCRPPKRFALRKSHPHCRAQGQRVVPHGGSFGVENRADSADPNPNLDR